METEKLPSDVIEKIMFYVLTEQLAYEDRCALCRHRLRKGNPTGEGLDWNDQLVVTNFFVNRKPLGQALVAGDTAHARLGVPNPRYTGNGSSIAHSVYAIHDEAAVKAHYRWWQQETQGYDYDVRFTNQYHTRTPVPLPNLIPHFH